MRVSFRSPRNRSPLPKAINHARIDLSNLLQYGIDNKDPDLRAVSRRVESSRPAPQAEWLNRTSRLAKCQAALQAASRVLGAAALLVLRRIERSKTCAHKKEPRCAAL